jgi:hypothetical protein
MKVRKDFVKYATTVPVCHYTRTLRYLAVTYYPDSAC